MAKHHKSLSAEERRAVTVQAVIDLAAEQNPGDITTAAIAQRMGLTQGALFRHFPTKSAVMGAVMTWVADCLLARLDRAAQEAESPLMALEAMFMAHVDFVAEHPGVPRMLFGQLQRPEETSPKRIARTLIEQYGKRVRQWLQDGRTQGQLDAALDVDAAAVLFVGTVQGLVMQSLMAGDVARIRRDAPGVFAIYRRGVGSDR